MSVDDNRGTFSGRAIPRHPPTFDLHWSFCHSRYIIQGWCKMWYNLKKKSTLKNDKIYKTINGLKSPDFT